MNHNGTHENTNSYTGTNGMMLLYLETRRRQLIAELRTIERLLIDNGRITKSALKPARDDR